MIFIFDMFHAITEIGYSIFTLWLEAVSLVTMHNRSSVSISLDTNGQAAESQLCQPFSQDKWETESCIGDHRFIWYNGGEQRIVKMMKMMKMMKMT